MGQWDHVSYEIASVLASSNTTSRRSRSPDQRIHPAGTTLTGGICNLRPCSSVTHLICLLLRVARVVTKAIPCPSHATARLSTLPALGLAWGGCLGRGRHPQGKYAMRFLVAPIPHGGMKLGIIEDNHILRRLLNASFSALGVLETTKTL